MLKKMTLILLIVTAGLLSLFTAANGEVKNLAQNSGFEELKDGAAANWYSDVYPAGGANFTVKKNGAHSGANCFMIENKNDSDAKIIQDVNVQRNQVYKLSCWVKVDGIQKQLGGANISVLNGTYSSKEIFDTGKQWQPLEVYVRTGSSGPDVLKLGFRLGGFGALNKGKASFDDVSVEWVEKPDPGLTVANLVEASSGKGGSQFASNNEGHKTGTSFFSQTQNLIYLVLGIIVIGLLIFVELKLSKKNKKKGNDEPLDT
jgi:dolichyl-phosphate-mannose-protein mannosyltransferase